MNETEVRQYERNTLITEKHNHKKLFRSVESGLASGITSDATCTPTAIQLMVLPTQRLRTRLGVRVNIEERR